MSDKSVQHSHTTTITKPQRLRQMWAVLQVFAGHYRQSPLQAGAILLGVMLAVTLFVGVQAINANAKRSYSESTEQLSARASYHILPVSGERHFDEQLYFELRQAGVSRSLPVIEGSVRDDQGRRWSVQGSDIMAALVSLQNQRDDSSSSPNERMRMQVPLTRMMAGEAIALVEQSTVAQIEGWSVNGERIEVIQLAEGSGLGNRILMDISLAQRLLDKGGQLSYIALFESQLPDSLQALVADKARLQINDSGDDLNALTDSFHLNLTAMSLLAFLVGLFIAYNGVRYSLLKRERLLMQLQHAGILQRVLLWALLFELVVLVVVGSSFGFVLGLQLSHWLHPMVSVTLEQLYSATLLPGQWQWQWLAQATGLALVAALLACSAQFARLVATPLSRSVGFYRSVNDSARFSRLAIWGMAIIAIACACIAFSAHYRQTLFGIGLMVVGVPMLLPWLLSKLVSLLAKLKLSTLTSYAVAETRELIAPLSLAMMAMLLAVSSNIAINTLVGSFESTLRNWLEGRLHADLYISTSPADVIETQQFLQSHEAVSEVYQQSYLSTTVQGLPTNIGTKDPLTFEATTLFKQALNQPWGDFWQGESVFISEPMAIKLGLSLGDDLVEPFLGSMPVTVAGIFYDYGNPKGELLISPQLWQQLEFSPLPSSLGVSLKQGLVEQQALERLSQDLINDLGLSQTQLIDQQSLKQLAIEIFSRTFAITSALNVLTLAVAAIGLFTACYLIGQARQSAIAKLFTLGIKRRQLRLMTLGQMLLMVGLTCIIAIPVGYWLGRLLTENITLQAFGWTLFFEWNWSQVMLTIGLTLVVSVIATLLPLWQQTKRPLVSSLQSEVL